MVNLLIADQALDILTMLGFVILIGVVVNNAILIVHQSLNNVRFNNMPYREAVLESTRTRLRPIYMSATTSIFGMLPLVLVPGSGIRILPGAGKRGARGAGGFHHFYRVCHPGPSHVFYQDGKDR